MTTSRFRFCAALRVLAITLCATLAIEADASATETAAPYRPGVVLVGFEPGVSSARRHELASRVGRASRTLVSSSDVAAARSAAERPSVKRSVRDIGPIVELHVPSGTEQSAIRRLSGAPGVRYAEPDYLMRSSAAAAAPFSHPDAYFDEQWGLQNIGQSVNGKDGGTPGADERAVDAWGVETGSREIVVGETDTGVKYDHPDLAANVWTNPGGIGGCPAGTHGFNEIAQTCDPMDDEVDYGGHGTHVAGILGAVGDNGIGVTGVNWQTTILPVKAADSHDWGTTGQLIAGLQWLVDAKDAGVNVRVINDSQTYRGTARSDALSQELDVLASHDILFVTAAGNTGDDNDDDAFGRYPCRYPQDNVICVTASDQRDDLATFEEDDGSANYGADTVDLAAPGDDIYSTKLSEPYGYISGGSMASPQVAGAAALILSAYPSMSALDVKARILDNVDRLPSLSGKVLTGGRLNVCNALPGCDPPDTTMDTGPTGTINTDSATFTFHADETDATFQCKLDGAFTDCGSPKTYSSIPDGEHTFSVRAVDTAGNVDTTPASRSFTVDMPAPSVVTKAAGGVWNSAATLSGSVNPNATAVSECRFDYGATTSYGSRVPCAETAGDGSAPVDVSASLSGLDAGTTYHFRLVASSARGVGVGVDQTFVTSSASPRPPNGGGAGAAPGGGNSSPPGAGPRAPHHRVPAELEVSLLRIGHHRLEVKATMADQADGEEVRFTLHARGHRYSFSREARNGRLRFRKWLPKRFRRADVGWVEIRYGGSDTVRPVRIKLHVAERKADLSLERARLRSERLDAEGTVSRRARGLVHVNLTWEDDESGPHVWRAVARIHHHRWRLNRELPAGARDGGSLSVTYRGHHRVQGERVGKQVTPEPPHHVLSMVGHPPAAMRRP